MRSPFFGAGKLRPSAAIDKNTRHISLASCTAVVYAVPDGQDTTDAQVRTKSGRARCVIIWGNRRPPMSANPKTAPSAAAELDPLDLYNVRSMLSDEERLVQDSVA